MKVVKTVLTLEKESSLKNRLNDRIKKTNF